MSRGSFARLGQTTSPLPRTRLPVRTLLPPVPRLGADEGRTTTGWTKPKSPGEYALVTCGPRDKNRFYSNGLNLESAATTEGFFQCRLLYSSSCRRGLMMRGEDVLGPMYIRLLTFPIPTVCALNGHAYASVTHTLSHPPSS